MKKNETWGIVGGGLLGLTLAYRLAQRGYRTVIYEAGPEIGGLAGTFSIGNIVWDRFYHVILKSDSNLRTLLKEMGLDDSINWTETKTGFYCGGKMYSMSGLLEFLKFPPISFIDKMRLGITILYTSLEKNWRKLEKIPIDTWLKKWSGRNNYEKIWLPLLRAKLGDLYKQASAAFIWATIQRMYAARKNGVKKEMFGYISGGYNTIINRLIESLKNMNVSIKTNHEASGINLMPSGQIRVKFSNGRSGCFDHVISTVPSPHFVKICSSISPEDRKKHNSITYLGVICLSIILKKPLSGFYITNITDAGFPFTGVIEMSALVDKKEFNNNYLVYLPKYVYSSSNEFFLSDEKILSNFFEGFRKMYPSIEKGDVVSWEVSRAKYVFALPKINYSSQVPSITGAIKNLHVVNSAYLVNGTLNINETIRLAESTLENILE